MAKVAVIALEDGFINGRLRKKDEPFSVESGQELGVSWFRPVVVDSIPQGEVEDEGDGSTEGEGTEVVTPEPTVQAEPEPKPKRRGKRAQADEVDDLG